MIIFLYGPDNFRSRQKLAEIVEQNKKTHKSGLNLISLDCLNSDFQDFKNAFETISMFESKKLIVLKNVFSNALFEKSLQGCKEQMMGSKDNIVFFEDGKIDSRKSFFKFLKEKALSHEFKELRGSDLRKWIIKEFQKYRLEPDLKAVDLLSLYFASDTWRISNEIKKIAANKLGKSRVSEEDVKNLTRASAEMSIFKAIEAVSAKNKKLSFECVHSLLEKGEHPLYLLSMINYQFRNLLLVKDLLERKTQYHLMSEKSGLHPFALKKSLEQCGYFSLAELKKIYQKIFQADLSAKTGKADPEIALDFLLASI